MRPYHYFFTKKGLVVRSGFLNEIAKGCTTIENRDLMPCDIFSCGNVYATSIREARAHVKRTVKA